jgi:hypothetical protein
MKEGSCVDRVFLQFLFFLHGSLGGGGKGIWAKKGEGRRNRKIKLSLGKVGYADGERGRRLCCEIEITDVAHKEGRKEGRKEWQWG